MSKKQIFRIILLLATAISLWFVPWILVKAWIKPLPKTVQKQVESAINQGMDGMIVYVDENGKPPAFYTAGWHNRENKIPADSNAFFKIASISKLYNAVVVAKLVNSKHLSLDKTVADYFPELAERIENADKITLKMLVQHRSGIPNYSNHPGFWGNPPKNDTESLELILDLPANFEPDTDYEYCNTNYLLIRQIIDKVVETNRFQFIKENILKPLNLNNTFNSLSEIDNMDKVMSGYHVGYDADLKADEWGMLATIEDVGIFLRALNDGSLFKEGEQEIYSSIYEYKHSGWVPGYQSFAEYHEDIDTVVILFNNTTDEKLYMWNLSEIIYNRIVKIVKRNK